MSTNLKELLNSGITELSPYEPGKPIEDLERELGLKDIGVSVACDGVCLTLISIKKMIMEQKH